MADFSDDDFRNLIDSAIVGGPGMVAEQPLGDLASWAPFTLSDAYTPRPPLPYLVADILYYPSCNIMYGGPGSMKSMLLADLALCVAAGLPWLRNEDDLDGYATIQSPVIWIDFDNGRRRTHERFDAIGQAHGIHPDAPLLYYSMPRPQLDLTSFAQGNGLLNLVLAKKARLLIIDNLGLTIGDAEENSGEMAGVMGNLRSIAEDAECATIMVHHQRKSSGNTEGARKGETLRGHSSIEASLDLALLVERKDGEDNVTIYPTKVRGYRMWESIGAWLDYRHREGTRDLAHARFYPRAVLTKAERELLSLRKSIMAEVVNEPGIDYKSLVTVVRDTLAVEDRAPGINKVQGTIRIMVEDGQLKRVGKNGTKVQFWPV